ncbi:hypothetical protein [Tunicatimonas pelagia]|uniref:hypothetical protein n=1 Tax=Tunicatimonas pelagia TaxID=931531 RepID=UPI0026650157|nr:hypothetical protein [Tunicatimonas pelagia]WKN45442.1 hypothetical protein P0M28_10780 [Tunicatimonas pelagia]
MKYSVNIRSTRTFASQDEKQAWLDRLQQIAEKYQDTLEIKLITSEENDAPSTVSVVLSPKIEQDRSYSPARLCQDNQ